MKQDQLLQDLGTKATFFGLGLLAAKKLRPYAKYFIIGGVALSAVPGVMAAVKQIKAKRSSGAETVEEAVVAESTPCCAEAATCCDESGETACCDAGTEQPAEPAAEECCGQPSTAENKPETQE